MRYTGLKRLIFHFFLGLLTLAGLAIAQTGMCLSVGENSTSSVESLSRAVAQASLHHGSGPATADAGEDKSENQKVLGGIWDPNKYISIDEIKPGMEAYCLTCYKGTDVEKFTLEVLGVVRNFEPGRNAILVQGTDERFIRTGPVAGCSGSPVYIDGRLAGALAFAWFFSKDPLYGVTPIDEMLEVGQFKGAVKDVSRMGFTRQTAGGFTRQTTGGFTFDFSKPIDFAEIDKQITATFLSRSRSFTRQTFGGSAGINPLPCPLITSGFPAGVCEQLKDFVEPFGFMVIPGISGAGQSATGGPDIQGVELAPGAVLVVPLICGDMSMFVLGTVTDVIGDKVYGFGHGFLSYGPVDLPMATGQVHTVMSSLARSVKLGSMLEIVGALTTDGSAAVFGQIGAKPKMIPLTIKVSRYNDPQARVFNCQVANNRLLTPLILRAAVAAAATYFGDFPPDHMIEYKGTILAENAEPIIFNNVSTSAGVNELASEFVGSIALVMNNPYKLADVKSLDFEIHVVPENILAHIWSVELSDTEVKAGQEIEVSVVVESYLAGKKIYQFTLEVPQELKPGKYLLSVCGSQDYIQSLRKNMPYRFMAQSFSSLIEALNNSLQVRRDKLYCLLALPPGGVAVEKAELPDLPATKAMLLQSEKRALRIQPYPHWLEKSLDVGTIVIDRRDLQITVEE